MPGKALPTLKVCDCGARSRKMQNRTQGWDKLQTTCLELFSPALKRWSKMEAFKCDLDGGFPLDLGNAPPVLSWLQLCLTYIHKLFLQE